MPTSSQALNQIRAQVGDDISDMMQIPSNSVGDGLDILTIANSPSLLPAVSTLTPDKGLLTRTHYLDGAEIPESGELKQDAITGELIPVMPAMRGELSFPSATPLPAIRAMDMASNRRSKMVRFLSDQRSLESGGELRSDEVVESFTDLWGCGTEKSHHPPEENRKLLTEVSGSVSLDNQGPKPREAQAVNFSNNTAPAAFRALPELPPGDFQDPTCPSGNDRRVGKPIATRNVPFGDNDEKGSGRVKATGEFGTSNSGSCGLLTLCPDTGRYEWRLQDSEVSPPRPGLTGCRRMTNRKVKARHAQSHPLLPPGLWMSPYEKMQRMREAEEMQRQSRMTNSIFLASLRQGKGVPNTGQLNLCGQRIETHNPHTRKGANGFFPPGFFLGDLDMAADMEDLEVPCHSITRPPTPTYVAIPKIIVNPPSHTTDPEQMEYGEDEGTELDGEQRKGCETEAKGNSDAALTSGQENNENSSLLSGDKSTCELPDKLFCSGWRVMADEIQGEYLVNVERLGAVAEDRGMRKVYMQEMSIGEEVGSTRRINFQGLQAEEGYEIRIANMQALSAGEGVRKIRKVNVHLPTEEEDYGMRSVGVQGRSPKEGYHATGRVNAQRLITEQDGGYGMGWVDVQKLPTEKGGCRIERRDNQGLPEWSCSSGLKGDHLPGASERDCGLGVDLHKMSVGYGGRFMESVIRNRLLAEGNDARLNALSPRSSSGFNDSLPSETMEFLGHRADGTERWVTPGGAEWPPCLDQNQSTPRSRGSSTEVGRRLTFGDTAVVPPPFCPVALRRSSIPASITKFLDESSALQLRRRFKPPTVRMRPNLPPPDPKKLCFKSTVPGCTHEEIIQSLEDNFPGVKVASLQYDPVYLQDYRDPTDADMRFKCLWVFRLSDEGDTTDLSMMSFRLRGHRVHIQRADEVYGEELRAYKLWWETVTRGLEHGLSRGTRDWWQFTGRIMDAQAAAERRRLKGRRGRRTVA